mgnify:CR=1 FL=1
MPNYSQVSLDLQGLAKRIYANLYYNSTFANFLNEDYIGEIRQTGTPMIEVLKQNAPTVSTRNANKQEIESALTPSLLTYSSVKVDLADLRMNYSFRIPVLVMGAGVQNAIGDAIRQKDSEVAKQVDTYGFGMLEDTVTNEAVWLPADQAGYISALNTLKATLFNKNVYDGYRLALSATEYANLVSALTSILKFETEVGVKGVDMGVVDEAYGVQIFPINDTMLDDVKGYFYNPLAVVGDSFFDSFVRSCVPLFVIASSYLLFPVKCSTGDFLKRRAVRILIPFILWTVVYAFVWGEPVDNFKNLLLNFNYAAGHLWFVYMLIGIYLLMPMLSGWAEKVGKKELLCYLGIWLFTTLIPLIRERLGGMPTVIYGPSGLPRQALYPLWGEASWNAYGTFYYMSGFIGYLLLGLYFRKFVGELSWKKTLAIAIPSYLAGFAISFGGFLSRVYQTVGTSLSGSFPAEGLVDKAAWWETTWYNDTIGVVLMAIAWILVFKKFKASGPVYSKVLLPVSKASYGMYLMHMFYLAPIASFFVNGNQAEPLIPVYLAIPVIAILTFICCAVTTKLISLIPGSRYIVG